MTQAALRITAGDSFRDTATATGLGTCLRTAGAHTALGTAVPERVLCSLFESGKLDISVGVCFVNFATGEIRMSTIVDTQTYVRTFHKLHVFSPDEIVVPQSYLTPVKNKLVTILNSNVSQGIAVTGVHKKYFRSIAGYDDVRGLCFERDWTFLEKELQDQHLALAALAGAVHHMQHSARNLGYDKFRVKYETSESIMSLDMNTIKDLQLVDNAIDRKGMSLMKLMDSTVTKMGERSLRSNLLQPLTDRDSIQERLTVVRELRSNVELLTTLRDELKNCLDLDKLFATLLLSRDQPSVEHSNQKINDIILVKHSLFITTALANALEGTTSSLLQQIHEICNHEAITQVQALIDEFINEDCMWASRTLDLKNQRCYAVKGGRNGLLDVSRQVYKVVVDEVMTIIQRLSEKHNVELEQAYNAKSGFHVRLLDHIGLETIPSEFINRTKKKKYLECTTLDIIKCNSRLDDTVNEIMTISNQVVENVTENIAKFLPILFMVTEGLGLLDLLQCFAFNSLNHEYSCPEFSDSLVLKSSRHPVIETLISPFIPNDICAINDVSRFQVITGMNMSGKSVYLRQVALLSVMAQVGSFVPVESATFKIFDSLRSRISVDGGYSNASTFASEMNEMVCILETVNDNSLVIIDELGRGSSINDAFAISLAICEHLLTTRATVFITTHFHELSTILGTKPGVVQNHMKTELANDQGDVHMRYSLTSGVIESRKYGLKIAKSFFASDIVLRAHEICRELEGLSKEHKEGTTQLLKNKRYINLVSVLNYTLKNPDTMNRELLIDIQNEFFNQP